MFPFFSSLVFYSVHIANLGRYFIWLLALPPPLTITPYSTMGTSLSMHINIS